MFHESKLNLTGLSGACRRSPVVTLLLSVALLGLAAWSAGRLTIDSQLESLAPADAPGTQPLRQVIEAFHFLDESLILVEIDAAQSGRDDQPKQAGTDRLPAFASRLEQALANDEDAAKMIRAVEYRAHPDIRRFIEQVMLPHAIHYMDDADFEAIRRRLTREGITAQMERNEAMMAAGSPAADRLARQLLRDPLRLHEIMLPAMTRLMPVAGDWAGGGEYLSPDGAALLIRIRAAAPATDMRFTRRFMSLLDQAIAQAKPDGLRIQVGGAYAIARHSESHIRRNMQLTIIGTIALMQLLFLLAHRRITGFLFVLIPAAAGVLLAFGLYACFFDSISPIVAGIGAIIAGLGVDYAIHFMEHHESTGDAVSRDGGASLAAPSAAARSLHGGLLHACLTSMAGFLAITASSIPALRGFALLGALGLAGALLAALTMLPALLSLRDRLSPPVKADAAPARFIPLLTRAITSRRSPMLLCILMLSALCAALALRAGPSWSDSDIAHLHPQPNPPMATHAAISRAFSLYPDPMVIHMQAADADQLLTLCAEVGRRLADHRLRDAGVAGGVHPALFAPAPEAAALRMKRWRSWDRSAVLPAFDEALEASSFSPASFAGYRNRLAIMIEPKPAPTLDDLIRHPGLAGMMLPAAKPTRGEPWQAVALVQLRQAPADVEARNHLIDRLRESLADLTGARLTGMSAVSRDLERGVHVELPRIGALALAFVVAWVTLLYRRWRLVLLTLTPLLMMMAGVIVAMRLTATGFNMLNMAGIPILVGAAIDNGIFLVSTANAMDARTGRDEMIKALAHRARAMSLCSLTTIIGFGSLMLASVPAMASLGLMLAAGMAGCWAGSLCIVAPLLVRLRASSGSVA